MATLDDLTSALRVAAEPWASSKTQTLTDSQYSAGFDTFVQGSGWTTYQEFVIPQLCLMLGPLCARRSSIAVLEIGPGPSSILGHLPDNMKQKIKRYAAFEPNNLFATKLEDQLRSVSGKPSSLSHLETQPSIWRVPFGLDNKTEFDIKSTSDKNVEKFDIVLFCHSMYGMEPKDKHIEQALAMLSEQQEDAMVVVFHREGSLDLGGLACHRTATFPNGKIGVADDDEAVDQFTAFIAGVGVHDMTTNNAVQVEWRRTCRALGRRADSCPGILYFSSPEIMVAFTRHSTSLPELTKYVPLVREGNNVKNREARLHRPASIIGPTEIKHVQECVRWALKHQLSLTVIGGGHSGQCLWRNVVALDMSAFDQIHILATDGEAWKANSGSPPLVVVGAGCRSGDIVLETMAVGLAIPLGSRPSVGAGLWLQGGIGHLARQHGLTCDNIVGAVMVSVASGEILCLGLVPDQYQPANMVRPDNEDDLLWAMKGAGTNFGIVLSVIFRACEAPVYSVQNRILPLSGNSEAQCEISNLDKRISTNPARSASEDAYLYRDKEDMLLGMTSYNCSTNELSPSTTEETLPSPEGEGKTVDGIGLFETEMYMSGMHGGHAGSKTSSFKRCVFMKHIGRITVAEILVTAVQTSPSQLCYLHLLQGGGAVSDVAEDATAFGCRDWDFACVITGVWARDKDGSEIARAAVQWVYNVVGDLLPFSNGVYGADLGPDPRDAILAAKAYGPNVLRLAQLKQTCDPGNILAHACPIPKVPTGPKIVFLVTGQSGAGKDHCANVWASAVRSWHDKHITARVASISDATKRDYAATTGADLERLLKDRAYKEQQRPGMTEFYKTQVRQRPGLPEEHFFDAVYGGEDVDVLFITGMRDQAPVASFSHLIPSSRVIQIDVNPGRSLWHVRHNFPENDVPINDQGRREGSNDSTSRPTLSFSNNTFGDEAVQRFADKYLFPFFDEGLESLAAMILSVPNFPRQGINFRHVLNIAEQPGGLELGVSLLRTHFTGDWAEIDKIACCETGSYIFASTLAARVGVSLALIREAGKLPGPTYSASKSSSHVSSSKRRDADDKRIELREDVVRRGSSVMVVDDVLASGRTLFAMLELLLLAGVRAEDVSVMVVAEFPGHRGRDMLHRSGFGGVKIQSLLVFDGR